MISIVYIHWKYEHPCFGILKKCKPRTNEKSALCFSFRIKTPVYFDTTQKHPRCIYKSACKLIPVSSWWNFEKRHSTCSTTVGNEASYQLAWAEQAKVGSAYLIRTLRPVKNNGIIVLILYRKFIIMDISFQKVKNEFLYNNLTSLKLKVLKISRCKMFLIIFNILIKMVFLFINCQAAVISSLISSFLYIYVFLTKYVSYF
jgi:hypothetical protein